MGIEEDRHHFERKLPTLCQNKVSDKEENLYLLTEEDQNCTKVPESLGSDLPPNIPVPSLSSRHFSHHSSI